MLFNIFNSVDICQHTVENFGFQNFLFCAAKAENVSKNWNEN